jgi:hypothetical protein
MSCLVSSLWRIICKKFCVIANKSSGTISNVSCLNISDVSETISHLMMGTQIVTSSFLSNATYHSLHSPLISTSLNCTELNSKEKCVDCAHFGDQSKRNQAIHEIHICTVNINQNLSWAPRRSYSTPILHHLLVNCLKLIKHKIYEEQKLFM